MHVTHVAREEDPRARVGAGSPRLRRSGPPAQGAAPEQRWEMLGVGPESPGRVLKKSWPWLWVITSYNWDYNGLYILWLGLWSTYSIWKLVKGQNCTEIRTDIPGKTWLVPGLFVVLSGKKNIGKEVNKAGSSLFRFFFLIEVIELKVPEMSLFNTYYMSVAEWEERVIVFLIDFECGCWIH